MCIVQEVKLSLMLQRNVLESVADFLSSAEGDSLRIGLELITRLSLECSRAMEAVQDSFLPLVIEVKTLVALVFYNLIEFCCDNMFELQSNAGLTAHRRTRLSFAAL